MEMKKKVNERKGLKSEEINWRKEKAKEWRKVDGRERKVNERKVDERKENKVENWKKEI